MAVPPTVGFIQALIDAVGESDNELGGLNQTRLTSAVSAYATLGAPFTWDGTVVVTTPDTSGVSVGDWIQLDEDGHPFQIASIVTDTSVTVTEQTGVAIPTSPTATALAATFTWDGSTTVATTDTAEVGVGNWIRLDSDGQWFEVTEVNAPGSVTVANPLSLTIPSGSSTTSKTLNPPSSVVANSLPVETTVDWPDSGKVTIGNVVYTYGSKTTSPPSLDDVTHKLRGQTKAGLAQDHPDQATVTDISRNRSAVDLARRAMLVEYAEGPDLNTVGRNLGVDRSPFLGDDDIFREVIKALGYNPKGTEYGIELALDAMVGEGNYTISEDTESFPNEVFITLPTTGDFVSPGPEGRAYLTGRERQQVTGDDSVDVENSIVAGGTVHSVTWADEISDSDFRQQKPSAITQVDYEGDAGTQIWEYDGQSEAADVVVGGSGDEDGYIEISDNSGSHFARYVHDCRLQPESYVSFEVNTYIDSSFSGSGSETFQHCAIIRDGSYELGWGVLTNGSGYDLFLFARGAGAPSSDPTVLLETDRYYNVELRKYGTDRVELWVDGTLRQTADYADFQHASSATTDTNLSFGSDYVAGNVFVSRHRFARYHVTTTTDYWGSRGSAADVNAANPTQIDVNVAGFFQAGDVGKRFEISDSGSASGRNNGVFEVASVLSDEVATLQGQTYSDDEGAAVNADGVNTRIRVSGRKFRYPDDLGKEVVISGSDQGNDGTYTIATLRDPNTLADLASAATTREQETDVCEVSVATFVTESGLTYRVDPVFLTEANVEWEMSATGAFLGNTLTLRQDLPIASGGANRVLSVLYSEVLSAQVLADVNTTNERLSTDPLEFSHYPFYLSDDLAFIRGYLDDLTAAGVHPTFLKAT